MSKEFRGDYYREFPVERELSSHIRCLWISENCSVSDIRSRIIPDGCTDLLFPLYSTDGVLFSAYMTRSFFSHSSSGERLFGIRFHPGCSRLVLRDRPELYNNSLIELPFFSPFIVEEIRDTIRRGELPDAKQLRRLLGDLLEERVDRDRLVHAVSLIERSGGTLPIEELAGACEMGRRNLEKRCKEYVGTGPKLFSEIIRFHRSALLLGQGMKGSEIALETGYYDQAHFVRSFRRFAGISPEEYRSSSHFYNTEKGKGYRLPL